MCESQKTTMGYPAASGPCDGRKAVRADMDRTHPCTFVFRRRTEPRSGSTQTSPSFRRGAPRRGPGVVVVAPLRFVGGGRGGEAVGRVFGRDAKRPGLVVPGERRRAPEPCLDRARLERDVRGVHAVEDLLGHFCVEGGDEGFV